MKNSQRDHWSAGSWRIGGLAPGHYTLEIARLPLRMPIDKLSLVNEVCFMHEMLSIKCGGFGQPGRSAMHTGHRLVPGGGFRRIIEM
ncbi:hypothetical protein O4H62_01385 [Hoeflea alexandrii]|nr:hypothetical protein [Hoeflea alexandrii]